MYCFGTCNLWHIWSFKCLSCGLGLICLFSLLLFSDGTRLQLCFLCGISVSIAFAEHLGPARPNFAQTHATKTTPLVTNEVLQAIHQRGMAYKNFLLLHTDAAHLTYKQYRNFTRRKVCQAKHNFFLNGTRQGSLNF